MRHATRFLLQTNRLLTLVVAAGLTLFGIGTAQAMGGAMIGLGAAMMGGIMFGSSIMHHGPHGPEDSGHHSETSGHGSEDHMKAKRESEPLFRGADDEEHGPAFPAPQGSRPEPDPRASPPADAHGRH